MVSRAAALEGKNFGHVVSQRKEATAAMRQRASTPPQCVKRDSRFLVVNRVLVAPGANRNSRPVLASQQVVEQLPFTRGVFQPTIAASTSGSRFSQRVDRLTQFSRYRAVVTNLLLSGPFGKGSAIDISLGGLRCQGVSLDLSRCAHENSIAPAFTNSRDLRLDRTVPREARTRVNSNRCSKRPC